MQQQYLCRTFRISILLLLLFCLLLHYYKQYDLFVYSFKFCRFICVFCLLFLASSLGDDFKQRLKFSLCHKGKALCLKRKQAHLTSYLSRPKKEKNLQLFPTPSRYALLTTNSVLVSFQMSRLPLIAWLNFNASFCFYYYFHLCQSIYIRSCTLSHSVYV